MGNLAIVNDATSIASNVTAIVSQMEGNRDTRDLRKVGNKLQYSLVTLGRARQLTETSNSRAQTLEGQKP